MSDKSLIDAIEDLLSESIADDINKITADNVKDGANLKPTGDKSSPDTQGVLGSTSGTALDAGGDKDVGHTGHGKHPSQASADTQGVLGTTSGSAMDAGGDTDVGQTGQGKHPSDASADTQGVEGKTTGAALDAGGDKDVGKLKEELEFDDVEFTAEEIEALVAEGFDREEIMSFFSEEEETVTEEVSDELVDRLVEMCKSKKKAMSEESDEELEEAQEPESAGKKSHTDANKEMRPEQEKDVNPQNKGGDPMGSTSGQALNAGGDKDVAPAGKKGQYPSEASSDTQGVLGKTKGAALDAGGDKDVGKLKEQEEVVVADTDEVEEAAPVSLAGPNGKKIKATKDPKTGKYNVGEDAMEELTTEEREEFLATEESWSEEVEEVEEKLHGDQHKLDHDKDGDIDAGDMKDVRKKGATAHLTKEEDESLSEDFKSRAEVIFEAAVGEKVSMIRENMEADFATKLEEETTRLNEQVSQYVDEAVAEWLKENALEVRYSLRTEIAEGFMKGLKNLFQESYIEIPDEDASVVDELTEAVEEQRDTIATLEEELKESKQFILEARRKDVLAQLTEDLTATQAVRLEKLSENIEAADVKEFKDKVEKLKEGYFDPSNEQPLIGSLSEEVLTGEQFIAEDDTSSVAAYAQFLTKTVMK